MDKLSLALRSRTAWMFMALFVVNGIGGVREFFSPQILTILDALIGAFGIWFRVNPMAK